MTVDEYIKRRNLFFSIVDEVVDIALTDPAIQDAKKSFNRQLSVLKDIDDRDVDSPALSQLLYYAIWHNPEVVALVAQKLTEKHPSKRVQDVINAIGEMPSRWMLLEVDKREEKDMFQTKDLFSGEHHRVYSESIEERVTKKQKPLCLCCAYHLGENNWVLYSINGIFEADSWTVFLIKRYLNYLNTHDFFAAYTTKPKPFALSPEDIARVATQHSYEFYKLYWVYGSLLDLNVGYGGCTCYGRIKKDSLSPVFQENLDTLMKNQSKDGYTCYTVRKATKQYHQGLLEGNPTLYQDNNGDFIAVVVGEKNYTQFFQMLGEKRNPDAILTNKERSLLAYRDFPESRIMDKIPATSKIVLEDALQQTIKLLSQKRSDDARNHDAYGLEEDTADSFILWARSYKLTVEPMWEKRNPYLLEEKADIWYDEDIDGNDYDVICKPSDFNFLDNEQEKHELIMKLLDFLHFHGDEGREARCYSETFLTLYGSRFPEEIHEKLRTAIHKYLARRLTQLDIVRLDGIPTSDQLQSGAFKIHLGTGFTRSVTPQ